jgi:hypothetical protein
MYDHLVYIQQQLKQRNIEVSLQQFYRVELLAGTTYYQFNAYNELLYLTNPEMLPEGTLIHSDCRARRIKPDINILEGIDDYSGSISIELPAPLEKSKTIEFIQIVTK